MSVRRLLWLFDAVLSQQLGSGTCVNKHLWQGSVTVEKKKENCIRMQRLACFFFSFGDAFKFDFFFTISSFKMSFLNVTTFCNSMTPNQA